MDSRTDVAELNDRLRAGLNDRLRFENSTDFGVAGKLKADFKKTFAFIRYVYGIRTNPTNSIFPNVIGGIIELESETLNLFSFKNRSLEFGIGYRLDFSN